MFVNFRDIPNHQNLFLDYLYDFQKVRKFYTKNFRDNTSFVDTFTELKKRNPEQRNCITNILLEQYSGRTISGATKNNIELLRSETTFAIVTGQQLGILGGPLYTFYKIITAIKLAKDLSEKYSGYNFVPVFWLEGDDHDFEEVSYINLIDNNNELVKLSYNDGITEEMNRGSVGSIQFNNNIEKFFNELNLIIRDNDYKQPLVETYSSFYKPGKTFKQAFQELILHFFDEYGLITFDPSDVEVKKLLRPVFANEIENFRTHTNDVVRVSAELEETTYHAQVKVRPINLFFSDNDGRYLLEPVDEEFRLKGKRKRFTKENLLSINEQEPQRFSANVLLRPICQDFLFPTLCYIGGPGEISYFAQVIPLYKYFNITQPIVYPRSSITIVENNVIKILNKYGFSYSDCFVDKDEMLNRILKSSSDMDLEAEFQKALQEINNTIDNLREKLFALDKTLNDVALNSRERIMSYIDQLKAKAVDAQKKKHETTVRQLMKAHTLIYPAENLQERELNYIYFAHKYGMNFIERIYNGLAINRFEHQILTLE